MGKRGKRSSLLLRPSVLAGTAFATSLLGLLLSDRCSPELWGATTTVLARGCYSDIASLYWARGFVEGVVPYSQPYGGTYFEYPVLTGAFVRVVQLLVSGINDATQRAITFMHVTSFMLATMAAITTYLVAAMTQSRRATLALALSPLLAFVLVVNWDMASVLCTVLALFLWRKERSLWAAVWAGLGTAFKLWPAFALLAFVIDALRRRDPRLALRISAAGFGAWLIVNAPVFFAYRSGWERFYTFSSQRGDDWGSLWTSLMFVFGWVVPISTQNTVGVVGMAIGIAFIGWRSVTMKASVPLITLSLVTLFITLGKAGAMQYSLWLLPLVALCVTDWRMFAGWQAVQLLFAASVYAVLLSAATSGERGMETYRFGLVVLLWHTSNITAALWAWREHSRSVASR